MTWDAFHRRGAVLRAVVDEANLRRDGALPRDLPGVAETFEDDAALVAALQLRWHTRLAGWIERALADQPWDLRPAVLDAWRGAATELHGVRLILDDQLARPSSPEVAGTLERARRKDWVLMAAMAGQASPSDHAAYGVGRSLEEQARAAYHPTTEPRHLRADEAGDRPSSLVGRLKAHLAA